MIISGFDIRLVELPYDEPIQWRSVYEAAGHYLVLRVCTDAGMVGLAEVADKPTWTGSTSRVTAQALREIYEPLLVGVDPLAPERVRARLEQVPGWSSARSLLDVALADLAARCAGLPLWKYLGGWTDEVQLSWLVNRGPWERRAAEAAEAVERYGFTALKVKIGAEPATDVALVRRLRDTCGPSTHIAVDANTSYSRNQGIKVADALHELDVSLFEDPCWLPIGAATTGFLHRARVPIMVDLQAGTPEQARAYADAGAHAIAIKVGRTGYRGSARIQRLCENRGVLAGVGVYAESGLGSMLSLHFYAAHRHLQQVPAESSFFLKLKQDILVQPLQVVGGKVRLPSTPGVGVELDAEVLERFSQPI